VGWIKWLVVAVEQRKKLKRKKPRRKPRKRSDKGIVTIKDKSRIYFYIFKMLKYKQVILNG